MKSKDKLDKIDELVSKINNNIVKNTSWNMKFDNKGANCYCLSIIKNKEEIFYSKFGTFDNVISALELIIQMFNKDLNDRK